MDTAGLREQASDVEAAGIALGRDQMAGADLVVWVEAADASPVPEVPQGRHVVFVESKRDCGARRPEWLGVTLVGVLGGVASVRDAIARFFDDGGGEAWIGLARHRECATEALASVHAAASLLAGDDVLEAVAFELGVAQRRLGLVTGQGALGPLGEEVLARVFSKFCIGK